MVGGYIQDWKQSAALAEGGQEVRSQGRRAMQMSPGLCLKQVPEGMNEFARESKRSVLDTIGSTRR